MSNTPSVILTALAVYLAVAVSPGPAFALVSRFAVAGDRRGAGGATLGLAIAGAAYAGLTLAGFTLLIERVAWLAGAVQIAGGLYLIALGYRAWREARPVGEADDGQAMPECVREPRFRRGLRNGLLVCWSNPKAIAFFISFYAALVPAGTSVWAKTVIIAGGFGIELGWYGLVALLLSTPPARRVWHRMGFWIERAIGTLLAGFGIRLIGERLAWERLIWWRA